MLWQLGPGGTITCWQKSVARSTQVSTLNFSSTISPDEFSLLSSACTISRPTISLGTSVWEMVAVRRLGGTLSSSHTEHLKSRIACTIESLALHRCAKRSICSTLECPVFTCNLLTIGFISARHTDLCFGWIGLVGLIGVALLA